MPYIHDGPPLWLTADKAEVVEDGDQRAAFLLVGTGGQLSDEEAKQHKLGEKSKAKQHKLGEKSKAKPEDKAKAAPANKGK